MIASTRKRLRNSSGSSRAARALFIDWSAGTSDLPNDNHDIQTAAAKGMAHKDECTVLDTMLPASGTLLGGEAGKMCWKLVRRGGGRKVELKEVQDVAAVVPPVVCNAG